MRPSFRLTRFAVLTVWALTVTGCATIHVNSFLERGTDFSRYRTYNWAASNALSTGDPRLDNNSFFQERVQADVEKELATRGFEKMTAARTPDLLLQYHAAVHQEVDNDGVDRGYDYCEANGCRPFVYETGTLVLDLIDARTHTLVWRAWADGALDGAVDSQAMMEQRIDDAVTRILEKLPRRL